MEKQEVIFYIPHEEVSFVKTDVPRYQITESCGWVWLQKLCFWVLRKIGCVEYAERKVRSFKTAQDGKPFMELLFEQQHALAEYFSRKPSTLLIGTEDYERIVCQEHELMQEIMFSQTFHHGGKIFGLNVRVIPWMSGILVLP